MENLSDMAASALTDIPYTPVDGLSGSDQAQLRSSAESVRIVVVGSLNLDHILEIDGMPEDDSTLLVQSEASRSGGHAGNCAAAFARLGVSVEIVAAVGEDPDGDRLVQELREQRVGTGYVRRFRQARTGRVIIPLFRDRHFMLMSRGANDLLGADDVNAALVPGVDAVVVFDPTPAALLAVAERISWLERPPRFFWTPGGVYARHGLAEILVPVCSTVFLNRYEFELISARRASVFAGGARPEAVITLGAEGAISRSDEESVKVRAPLTTAVDPTGAGDAFCAAYVLASLAALETQQRLLLANAAGAAAVTAVGARGRLASLDELIGSVAKHVSDEAEPVPASPRQ